MTQFNPDDIKLPAEWPGQVQALARTVLATAGGYLIGKGYLTGQQVVEIAGVGIPLLVYAWSAISHHFGHKALNAAIIAPAGQAS